MPNLGLERETSGRAQVFLVQRGFWISQLVFSLALLALFVFGMENLMPGRGRYLGLALFLIQTYMVWQADWLPKWRTWLIIDQRGVFGMQEGTFYGALWHQILAAKIERSARGWPLLQIITYKYPLAIPLKHLDHQAIWRALQAHLEDKKLGEAAHRYWLEQQDAFQEMDQAYRAMVENPFTTLKGKRHRWVSALGVVGTLFFGCALALSTYFAGPDWSYTPIFVGATLLFLLILPPHRVEMDALKLTYVAPPFGRHQMRWEEIERIEYTANLDWMVLYGSGKRLAMIGPAWWSRGPQRQEMIEFLRAQVHCRKIQTRVNPRVQFVLFCKGTRVR